jgi:ornithine cyclodeaminase/alanine dehydrogenase-like protein (mu-crystallin family)
VKKVSSGWRGSMEVNTAVFDPARITVEQMEEALKRAGTYWKTFRDP